MAVPAEHRRWIIINALVITTLVNLAVNVGLAWNQTRDGRHVVMWSISAAHPSVGTDTLGTLVMLPLITTLLGSIGVRRELASNRLARLTPAALGRWARLAVPSTRARAVRMAGLTFAVFAVPAVVVLELTVRDGMTAHGFAIYHVALAVALGMLVTPVIMATAMTVEPTSTGLRSPTAQR